MIYKVFNQGELGFGCGWRSVILLKAGHKWISLLDWTTLESAKISVKGWNEMRPIQAAIKPSKVLKQMKERLKYVEPTDKIKQALLLVKALKSNR